jgi:putative hemolysin
MGGWLEYFILILLVMLNAFFAASELSVISVRKIRIRQLAEEGNRRARAVLRLSDNPRRFLATIQVGATFTGFFASAFGAVSLVDALGETLKGIAFLAPIASTLAFILVTVLIALFTLIFGELVPKTLAVEAAESIALFVARPVEFIAKLAAPIIAFLTGTTNLIVRLLGGKRKSGAPTVTQEELVSMVTVGQEEGVFQPQQEEFIRSVFDFSEKRVREVLIPRVDMVLLEASMTISEAAKIMAENEYSRYPVYTRDRENITGVIFSKDVLRCYAQGQTNLTVAQIARPPVFVPESKPVSDLFTELQISRSHLAIIIDEYGGVAGLVTLEDLLEEIVGEIQDEFDHEENTLTPAGVNEYIVSGRISLYDLNQELDLEIGQTEDGERVEVDTLGGFLMAELKHIPVVGEIVRLALPRPPLEDDQNLPELKVAHPEAVSLTVLEMEGRRVNKVSLKLEFPDHRASSKT